jgi:transcription elongation factor Elf1
MQRVEITCPHCAHVNVRLAASVKKGITIACGSCRKRFRVTKTRALLGSAKR